jgi:hypothetical protein
VLWGINASYSHINLMSLVKKARQRSAFIVGIDPTARPPRSSPISISSRDRAPTAPSLWA